MTRGLLSLSIAAAIALASLGILYQPTETGYGFQNGYQTIMR